MSNVVQLMPRDRGRPGQPFPSGPGVPVRPRGRRVFRPGLWGALFGGGAILLMLGLGTWQLQRLEWKRDLLAHIHARMSDPAVDLPGTVGDPGLWDYRRVRLEGTFLNEHELYVGARSLNGVVGFEVITPLVRADGRGVVLVDRGWVPGARHFPADRPDGQPAGTVTVEGVARVPPPKFWAQPHNRPQENFWFYYDLPNMAAYAGVEDVAPVVVQADATPNPGGYPVGGQTRVNIPNDHLQYALTWYALAVALAVICWVRFSREEEEEESAP